ncbi:MAG: IS200/IS605 family transposase [Pirellulales bacterium]|nr:IS200/IS605 family transposase [Pirellulales bacterium]
MGSTYSNLHYHWICSTKKRRPLLRSEWGARFHEYLGGTIRGLGGVPLQIGGVDDHVHALLGLKTTHCIADFVRELKKASSFWAANAHERQFAWQEGYSIFTVSASRLETVRKYIMGQEEHHRNKSFREELEKFLVKHGVSYDPKYLD